jgi:hypothetical protein
MAVINSLTGLIVALKNTAISGLHQITDAQYPGDPNATKANSEYFHSYIHRYLKALSWSAYTKNVLFVKLDAPADFATADGLIYNTAQAALNAIPTVGAGKPTALNPYVILGDPLVDFTGLDWTAHDAAGTTPYIKTVKYTDIGSGATQLPKKYVADCRQAGSNAPFVSTLVTNTLGGVPVWSRASSAVYLLTLAGAFPVGKVDVPRSIYFNGELGVARVISVDHGPNAPDDLMFTFFSGNITDGGSIAEWASPDLPCMIDITVYP